MAPIRSQARRRQPSTPKGQSVTEGERAFEMYLESAGLAWCFEEPIDGITKRPDYRLTLDGEASRFEIKQFDPKPDDFRTGYGGFDPYSPIRAKIEAARKKFKGLKGTASCSLVLFNNGKPFVLLGVPYIYGAMLGDVGLSFPFDAESGTFDTSKARRDFLGGGKMHRHAEDRPTHAIAPQNTTISAIVVVCGVSISSRHLAIAIALRERALGRSLSFDERFAMVEERLHERARDVPVRVRVHDSPYAAKQLSRDFGRGPWDERFGPTEAENGHVLARTYVGAALAKLEDQETAAGIEIDWAKM